MNGYKCFQKKTWCRVPKYLWEGGSSIRNHLLWGWTCCKDRENHKLCALSIKIFRGDSIGNEEMDPTICNMSLKWCHNASKCCQLDNLLEPGRMLKQQICSIIENLSSKGIFMLLYWKTFHKRNKCCMTSSTVCKKLERGRQNLYKKVSQWYVPLTPILWLSYS